MKTILVAGGAGYVGSHTVIKLIEEGYDVVLVDNFSNANPLVVKSMEKILGKKIESYGIDLCNIQDLSAVFNAHTIDGVIHFAGLKSVGESAKIPLKYYHNNLSGTLNLLTLMEEYGVYNLVFSSSATVYGIPETLPISEGNRVKPVNTYGKTKAMIEEILQNLAELDHRWNFISLRFFNPLGAHKSGDLGEDPNGIPNNLAPYITQIAAGKLDKLNVFGNNFDTPDGTSIRDYMHIDDLAKGHVAGLKYLLNSQASSGFEAVNLGSGQGYSVLEIIQSFEEVTGKKIPYEFIEKRHGDVAKSLASVEKAKELLNWTPTYSIKEMCADTWHWQQKHPNGYSS